MFAKRIRDTRNWLLGLFACVEKSLKVLDALGSREGQNKTAKRDPGSIGSQCNTRSQVTTYRITNRSCYATSRQSLE
jgi:hypothetical protein